MVKDEDTKFSGTSPDQLEWSDSWWGDKFIIGITPSQAIDHIGEYAAHRLYVKAIDESVADLLHHGRVGVNSKTWFTAEQKGKELLVLRSVILCFTS